jgi:U3 small nucleolar RNA-associated protein 25
MLYTERAHFFRRHRLRGACNLCVYAPPSNAHFYVELAHEPKPQP